MKKLHQGLILEEADQPSGGGGYPDSSVFSTPDSTGAFDSPTVTPTAKPEPTQQPQQEPDDQKPDKSPEEPKFTLKQMQELMQSQQIVQQQPQPQQQKEYTQEELDKISKKFIANDDFMAQLFGTDEQPTTQKQRVAAVNQLVEGITQHVLILSQAMMQQQLQPLQQNLTTVQGYVTQTAGQQAAQQFYKTYPALQPYGQLTQMVAQNLANQNFPSQEERLKAIATQTEALIKQTQPEFSLASAPKPQHQQAPTPATQQTGGGQGGAGNSPKSQTPTTPSARAAAALV